MTATVRIAAFGDVHCGRDSAGTVRPALESLSAHADVLLLAGDLTKRGIPDEAAVLAAELRDLELPMVAVLGNHDYHDDKHELVVDALADAGVQVLDGTNVTLQVNGVSVGVAGVKGFGGGFAGASGSDFGEREMKAFMRHSKSVAADLEKALLGLDTDIKVALMHYSPVEETLQGERLEIYPFLGSYFLAEAVDHGGAQLALHGHAHGGSEKGLTPGGVHVRNVAIPVIKQAYRVFCLSPGDSSPGDCAP
jgi:Icc-related predicted phosphoesterase